MLTQFAFGHDAQGRNIGPSYSCIAVSRTADPVGAGWCVVDFKWSESIFYDYPKLGVWGDYYVLTGIGFGAVDKKPRDQQIGLLERQPLLDCEAGSTPRAARLTTDPYPIWLPADIDGRTAVGLEDLPLVVGFADDHEYDPAAPPDKLVFGRVRPDFDRGTAVLELDALDDEVAPFDSNLCGGGFYCIPVDFGFKLDALPDRLMNRAAFRRFDGSDALVLTHTVDVDGRDRAGVRWYELRREDGRWRIANQGTFAPSDGNARWLGSAAMDAEGNLAVVYAVSGPDTYPSVRYAARRPGDPPGKLSLGEGTLIEGGGVQLSPFGRWGDYGSLTVDPLDDCTFWYTGQYYPSTSLESWATKVVRFRLPGCPA